MAPVTAPVIAGGILSAGSWRTVFVTLCAIGSFRRSSGTVEG